MRVVGVRHHSPACARLVRSVIHEESPGLVLVEGPADFNPRIQELLLPHTPPLAIYSYYQKEDGVRASWTPFCNYSPEWVALQEGRRTGAQVLFMDLPAWTRAFQGVENRYSDRPSLGYTEELCHRLHTDGSDSLWDHLFEQPLPDSELEGRLAVYFQALRESEPASESDLEREAFMAGYMAWGASRYSRVVVVCGGFHKPQLERSWEQSEALKPEVPTPEEGVRWGSFLVPYSYHRLDSFAGYASGMPSPYYYHCLWEYGPERAATELVKDVVKRLRDKKQAVSAADLIQARVVTQGLMRLRDHALPTRSDLLDGLAGALVKDALDVPLPWTERGPLHGSTHPILVEMVAAFSGLLEGELDPRTPLPPLVAEVKGKLSKLQLLPERTARLFTTEKQSEANQVLHRLRLIEVPGFTFQEADPETETWQLSTHPLFESALIEAGAWGATLEEAVGARLEERLSDCDGRLDLVAGVLRESYRAGLPELSQRLLDSVEREIRQEARFGRLGQAAGVLLEMWRERPRARLGEILEMLVVRGLWLFESLGDSPEDRAVVQAVVALRDIHLHGESLALDLAIAQSVMRRRVEDRGAPPLVKGAALGFLWSTGGSSVEQTLAALQRASLPSEMGDFLAGLFGLAREEVVHQEGLVRAIDQIVCGYGEQDFMTAIPSLRMAFSYFAPRERERVAHRVATIHGLREEESRELLRLGADADTLVHHRRLEARVSEWMERFGLGESSP